ncbi:hypothetical protein ACFC3F_14490 [Microbacterium sp. NPDC055910]|uniref:hypothetical protein n=1 Tax=Microbacterium sp. NPDC055910 TaxID=3345659 RepID=UPI0035E1CFE6
MSPSPLPEALGDPFAVSSALALGVGAGRLRGRDLDTPFFGVRSGTPPPNERGEASVRRRANAFAVRMRSTEFFCLVSACALWGAPLPNWIFSERDAEGSHADRPLDVGVLLPARAPRGSGVRGRSVKPGLAHIVTEPATGLRATSPAATWAMMGALLSVEDLVVLGDYFVREPMRREDPPALTTVDQLAAMMTAGRRRGIAALRESLPLIRIRSRSRQETRTRLTLVDGGLPEPELNWPVVVDGRIVALIDLAYPELLLGFEYEGEHHLTDPEQWATDITRIEMLADLGWRIIRVVKSDLKSERAPFLARARGAYRARASASERGGPAASC